VTREAKYDRLYARAFAILDGQANGLGTSILWHLALRRHGLAMLMLAGRFTYNGDRADLGRPSDAFGAAGLYYRAWRQGEPFGAQNMAMDLFNNGDMQGYRHWLRRAARAGDADSAAELRRFETRLPHGHARKSRRIRPYRRTER